MTGGGPVIGPAAAPSPPPGAAIGMWQPVTEPERAMLASGGDRDAYLAALVAGPLLLPVSPAAARGLEAAAWPTALLDGETHVLAFTSPEAIAACLPGERVEYRIISLAEIVHQWPDPAWWLAVDPGLPIGERISGVELGRLPDPPGAVEVEERWRDAIAREDPDALTAALLRAEIVVPLRPDGSGSRDVTDPDFPWWCLPDDVGQPCLPVFTSEALSRQVLGDHEVVLISSAQLAANWPDPAWQLLANPGTALAASIPGASVRVLNDWLGQLRTVLTEAADEERRRLPADEVPTPAGPEPRDGPDRADGGLAAEDDGPDPDAPLLLQVVIPHRYLSSYLEQGYDRAAGLVHRWWGAGRETPQRLYQRLGLLGEGSPFRGDDEWVVVLRWAPVDDTGRRWARGEPRMEALVVPDGAELHKIDRAGNDELLARFDATGRRWLPADLADEPSGDRSA